MKQLVRVALAGVMMFGSSGAFAADMAVKARPLMAQQVDSWTGFYIGAAANYHSGTVLDEGCVGLCEHNHRVQDWYGTVNIGYDYQFANRVVIGVLGWVGVTPVESEASLAPGVVVKGKTDAAAFGGVRLGYAAGHGLLPYVFAGAEIVHGNVTIAVAPVPVNERTHTGFGTGVGLEYRLAPNWSIDGRYMYSYLGRQDYNFGGGVTTAAESANTLSIGVNYRFGAPIVARY